MRTALVTASYAADLERCQLLCETVDALVSGASHHYILVATHDVARFRPLQSASRTIIDESDLLPSWLRPFRDPLSLFSRHVWLSPRTMPLRGWHVQQLRRMAIARFTEDDAYLYCDSDVAFLRPFDCSSLWRDGALRLFRKSDPAAVGKDTDQDVWYENAGRLLGIVKPPALRPDYIGTLIAWRRDTTIDMLAHIERLHGLHWVAAVARQRRFSECMIYGRYADEIDIAGRHFHDAVNLCSMRWTEPLKDRAEITRMIEGLGAGQVAIGIQSFLGVEPALLRECMAEAANAEALKSA